MLELSINKSFKTLQNKTEKYVTTVVIKLRSRPLFLVRGGKAVLSFLRRIKGKIHKNLIKDKKVQVLDKKVNNLRGDLVSVKREFSISVIYIKVLQSI